MVLGPFENPTFRSDRGCSEGRISPLNQPLKHAFLVCKNEWQYPAKVDIASTRQVVY